jgi:c-di-GMP-binding flagellar brake protein YcgR
MKKRVFTSSQRCRTKLEERRHIRFPVPLSLPVKIFLPQFKRNFSGIISDIGAGGLGLITLSKIPEKIVLEIQINLPGLKLGVLKGKVAWIKEKEGTYQVGIRFTKVSEIVKKKINKLADAFDICETKIFLGARDVCFKKCVYYPLCTNELKKI